MNQGRRQNMILAAIFVGVSLVLLLAVGLGRRSGTTLAPFDRVTVDGRVGTSQETMPAPGPAADSESRQVDIYLDVSQPVAGFLGPSSTVDIDIRSVAAAVPVQMARVYGGLAGVDWHAVDDEIRPLDGPPDWRRSAIRGGETFLDLPVREALQRLADGEIVATAILTDLVATREVIGSIGLLQALSEWLDSPAVRSGEMAFGLLGVRLPYYGVPGRCESARHADLGCWFSEETRSWSVMTRPVERPLYVLVLGRAIGADGTDRIDALGRGMLEALTSRGVEGHWELLTKTRRDHPAVLTCRLDGAAGEPTAAYALWVDEELGYRCQQDAVVGLRCGLVAAISGSDAPLDLEIESAELSWPTPWTAVRVERGELRVAVDCEQLRAESRDDDLAIRDLRARVGDAGHWSTWSVSSDRLESDLDRTLQLAYFVEQVRAGQLVFSPDDPLLREVRP